MFRVPNGWRGCALALLLYTVLAHAWACSPPRQRAWAGFPRAAIGQLPANARGVMFYAASGKPRPADFRVTSGDDPRPLPVRVHALEGAGWVRLEPVDGFQPGVRYRFRYLPRHGDWKYPDDMTVAIDDTAVASEGAYSVELAAAPAYRVVLVPTSSGSCVEPSPAVVQAFTYRVPPALLPYRDALVYAPTLTPSSRSWTEAPAIYETPTGSLGVGFSTRYTALDNAVVAACGARRPRIRLTARVSFPELETSDHRTPAVELDLDRHVEGRCEPLDALLRSVDVRAPEPGLRELCHGNIAGSFAHAGIPLRAVEPMEWARELSNVSAMSVTCNLVALAHLWQTEPNSLQPALLRQLGDAIAAGWRTAGPTERDAAVHALAYLADRLPETTRAATARALLAPLRPALAEAHTAWPDELAQLVSLAGPAER
jgi:hypothetical protein